MQRIGFVPFKHIFAPNTKFDLPIMVTVPFFVAFTIASITLEGDKIHRNTKCLIQW